MMEYNKVKTERIGFERVHDANGKWIVASKEQRCTQGFCPYCKCEMYMTHKGDLYYFARKPGKNHVNRICQQIERTGKIYCVEKTSFIDLIRVLCHVGVSRGSGMKGELSEKNSVEIEEQLVSSEVGFKSLNQIYAYGLTELQFQSSAEIVEIKKYIIYHPWAKKILENAKGDLAYKIVYAKFIFADYDNRRLHFLVYEEGWNYRFILCFKNPFEFRDYYYKFMKKEACENGTSRLKKIKKHQTVFIAAEEWNKINEDEAKQICGNDEFYGKRLGVYMTEFRSNKQIYLTENQNDKGED